jgi:hypothetical protein
MSPGTRRLFTSLGVFVIALAEADATLARYAQRHYGPNKTLSEAVAAGDGCIVTIGDSRMAAGIDAEALRSAIGDGACVASLGIGAIGIEGQSLALRRYIEASRTPRVVVLGGGPILPSDPIDPSKMVGNVAVELAWSKPGDVGALFPGFPFESLDAGLRFSLERTNAIESYASVVWEKMQLWQARLTGAATRPSNRFGLVEDMQGLAGAFASNAVDELERWSGRWQEGAWFDAIDAATRRAGATLVVVHVPMVTTYRGRVNALPQWKAYEAWLAADLGRKHDVYVDLSASVDDGLFADGVHLGGQGARVFSTLLGRTVAPYRHGSPRQ